MFASSNSQSRSGRKPCHSMASAKSGSTALPLADRFLVGLGHVIAAHLVADPRVHHTVADRGMLRASEGRGWPRPRRGAQVRGLVPPCDPLFAGARLPDCPAPSGAAGRTRGKGDAALLPVATATYTACSATAWPPRMGIQNT